MVSCSHVQLNVDAADQNVGSCTHDKARICRVRLRSLRMQKNYRYVQKKGRSWQGCTYIDVEQHGRETSTRYFRAQSSCKAVAAWGADVFNTMAYSTLGKVGHSVISSSSAQHACSSTAQDNPCWMGVHAVLAAHGRLRTACVLGYPSTDLGARWLIMNALCLPLLAPSLSISD